MRVYGRGTILFMVQGTNQGGIVWHSLRHVSFSSIPSTLL